ncbi:MAG TPA: ABC transporter ATP-binding protein [Gaiellaceae bacterium]|nr:ABC transporter ATP-binding protein [Gaiellaceae bacterium]
MTLELRNLVKHYETESDVVRAVDGVSLTVGEGEVVAICGPSGSGKTTLLMLAAALLAPDSGCVVANGREISRLDETAAARYRLHDVGFVFQSSHLINSASVRDNAAIKLLLDGLAPAEARRRVEPWLVQLGLGHRLRAVPSQLSAGERQRIAIARALSNDPKLLFADEPTGNLDAERGREVFALLRDFAHERKMPALIVTHDPQAAEWVDRAFVLRDGSLLGQADQVASFLPTSW